MLVGLPTGAQERKNTKVAKIFYNTLFTVMPPKQVFIELRANTQQPKY